MGKMLEIKKKFQPVLSSLVMSLSIFDNLSVLRESSYKI